MPLIRTENAHINWCYEQVYDDVGNAFRNITDYRSIPHNFGLFETITAPDPTIDWYPYYGVSSGRSRSDIFPGKWNLRASIPDIRLQRGYYPDPLRNTPDSPVADILEMCIGQQVPGLILNPSNPPPYIQVVEGLDYVLNGSINPDYGANQLLQSMALQIAMRDISSPPNFWIRNYYGGKINRWTLSAQEGDCLRLSLDEIIFKRTLNDFTSLHLAPQIPDDYSIDLGPFIYPPAPSHFGQYWFAGATITIAGITVARVKSFRLSGDNQLQPKFYLSQALTNDPFDTQLLNDLVEGKRAYTLDLEIDVADSQTDLYLLKFMLSQGMANVSGATQGGITHVVGFPITLEFRNDDPDIAGVTDPTPAASFTINGRVPDQTSAPAAVFTSGSINLPAPPAGYWDGRFSINLDSIYFNVPLM